jgi:CHAT domain-containing protein
VSEELLERERTLRKEINYWSWQLWQQAAQPAGAARETLAASSLSRLLAEHDQAEADIRRADQRYSSVLRPETLPLDVVQREVIDADTVLVSFHLGRDRSFVWAVTRDAVRLEVLPARAEIERRVRRYLALVNTGAAVGVAPEEIETAGLAVTNAVLQPFTEVLRRRRVMIVADGILHFVPFAALPRGGGGPFLQANDTVVLPSATVLALLRRELAGRPPAPRMLAVIADPVFEGNDPRVQAPRASGVRGRRAAGRFTRLPYSRDEADRILELTPPALSMKALDFQASRALATSPAIGEYRFLHLATHAVQDDQRPALSGIVFSRVDAKGAAQDGFLRLHDVYNLDLRADLVVLSACETGTGRQLGGEGVASLARGLFHAGAARVVSTLWEVDDEATSHLMQLFYKQLLSASAPAPSSALRLAQAAMRKHPRWSHPYYWAGFVLQGEW